MSLFGDNVDELIESYDVQEEPLLEEHFRPIEKQLWHKIENYADEVNEYGAVMGKHLQRTSAIGMQFITSELGFSEKAGRNFYDANLMHDLGKTHPCYHPSLWQLPHRPTPEEREEKRAHTRLGVELFDLALVKTPKKIQQHPHIHLVRMLQLYHHERCDSDGYEGKDVTKMGKVIQAICIIDAFDGDMIHRPHQRAKRTPQQALERMKIGRKYKGAFDPDMLERFIAFQLPEG